MWKANVLRGAVAVLGMVALVGHAAQADKGTQTGTQASAQGQLSKDDRNFIMEAAQGGMMEVQMGKLAQEKGQSDGVKQFGKRLEEDHSKANQELMDIAKKNGVNVPASLDKKHQAQVEKMSKVKPDEFDRRFAKEMVDDHEKDVKKFRRQAEKGQNAELKQFAGKTTPILEEHLKMARDLSGAKSKSGAKGGK